MAKPRKSMAKINIKAPAILSKRPPTKLLSVPKLMARFTMPMTKQAAPPPSSNPKPVQHKMRAKR